MTCLVMELGSGCRIHNTATLAQLSRVFPPPQFPCHTYTLIISHLGACSRLLSGFLVFTQSAFPSDHLHIVTNGRFLKRISEPLSLGGSCLMALHCSGQLSFLGLHILDPRFLDPWSSEHDPWALVVSKICRRSGRSKLIS